MTFRPGERVPTALAYALCALTMVLVGRADPAAEDPVPPADRLANELLTGGAAKDNGPLTAALSLHALDPRSALSVFAAVPPHEENGKFLAFGRARLLASLLRNHEARSALQEQALDDKAPSPRVLYEIAVLEERQGDTAIAAKLLRRCVAVDPFFGPAQLALVQYDFPKERQVERLTWVLLIEPPGSPVADKALAMLKEVLAKQGK